MQYTQPQGAPQSFNASSQVVPQPFTDNTGVVHATVIGVVQDNNNNNPQQPQQQQQQQYIAPIQQPTLGGTMVRNTTAVAPAPSPQVFPVMSITTTDPVMVDWKTVPQIRNALSDLSRAPLAPYAGEPVLIRDLEEDHDVTDNALLTYRPQYYMNTAPMMVRDLE